ncbi:unnamed protein product [Clonostachys byssicola]|uniref:DNA2/NAM7 helicase-like C-terminal domain-containing protein n=1 Tax=Clonostachys byssicola TaxID=160290 RepID=A0A9N9U7R2_9HYPO|nr:unnamed protein product [Clonostachys byssicola]
MAATERTGPGFMSSENRLNVLLSRQKSGLVIIGDINIMGEVFSSGDSKRKTRIRQASGTSQVKVKGAGGKVSFVLSGFLINVCQELVDSARVAEAPAEWQAKD